MIPPQRQPAVERITAARRASVILFINSTVTDEMASAEALDSNNFRLFLGEFPLFSVRGLQLRLGVAFVQSAAMDDNRPRINALTASARCKESRFSCCAS